MPDHIDNLPRVVVAKTDLVISTTYTVISITYLVLTTPILHGSCETPQIIVINLNV